MEGTGCWFYGELWAVGLELGSNYGLAYQQWGLLWGDLIAYALLGYCSRTKYDM